MTTRVTLRNRILSSSAARRKIAWLSPFGPLSDIGAHSASIVRALHRKAEHYDCELVLFAQPNGATYATEAANVVMEPRFPVEMLSLFDVTVLNIGNNQENHSIINEMALVRGGLVVVHDIVMQHYLHNQFFDRLKMPARYADILCRYYGQRGIELLTSSGITLEDEETRFFPGNSEHALACPLIEPFLEKAKAVVVHSRFASEIVARFTEAPQLQLFLPSDKKPAPQKLTPSPDGNIRFTIMGHITRTKHIELCIEAFTMSARLRAGATLLIAGGVDDLYYIRELLNLVREKNVQGIVTFEFEVTESRLFEIKGTTDVFVNVRFPNTESASGSLAEQMACGVPTIVFDSGCFREMPAEAVFKIADISTPSQLCAAMEALAAGPAARQRIGKAAIDFGRNRTADNYATKFLEFIVEQDFRAPSTVYASGADFSPFPWLKRRLGAARQTENRGPSLFDPGERPNYRSIADLDALGMAQYLSVGLFRQSLTAQALESVRALVARIPRARLPSLVGRLAFFQRICEAGTPVRLSQLVFDLDASALAILHQFDAKKFVTVLFLSLIGRAPQKEEIQQALDAGASSGRLLWAFVHSADFARRAPPLDVIEALDEIAVKLDAAKSPEPLRWLLLKPGAVLSRHELAEVMGEDWHPMEPEGAWSRATSARLRFRLGPAEQRDGAAVQLDMRVVKPAGLERQGLQLVLNGIELAYLPIESSERFIVEIPMDDVRGMEAELALNVDFLVRPTDYDAKGDNRAVGVFVFGLRMTEAGASS